MVGIDEQGAVMQHGLTDRAEQQASEYGPIAAGAACVEMTSRIDAPTPP